MNAVEKAINKRLNPIDQMEVLLESFELGYKVAVSHQFAQGCYSFNFPNLAKDSLQYKEVCHVLARLGIKTEYKHQRLFTESFGSILETKHRLNQLIRARDLELERLEKDWSGWNAANSSVEPLLLLAS